MFLQAKLSVSQPGDAFEQEADRVADHVLRMPDSNVQRACSCGGECPKCQTTRPDGRQDLPISRVESNATAQIAAPPVVDEVLRSSGQPLDTATRAFVEPRFHHDFSRVRVHTGAKAAQSAREVNAHAYTVGHNIVFGADRFAPATHEGRRLIAHELTHVVQQASANETRAGPSIEKRGLSPVFPELAHTHRQPLGIARQSGTSPIPPGETLTGPLDKALGRKLPERRAGPPAAPRVTDLPLGAAESCLTGKVCEPPVPGSAWDFGRKAEREMTEIESSTTREPWPAREVKKVVSDSWPHLLQGFHEVAVFPAMPPSAAAGVASCQTWGIPAEDPEARCMVVPESLEKEAVRFNQGESCVGESQEEEGICSPLEEREWWHVELENTLTHEHAHEEFRRNTPVGVSSRTSNDITLHELDELYAQLSEFPVLYGDVLENEHLNQEKKEEHVTKRFRRVITSKGEGIQGILTKLRCINPCETVDALVRSLTDAVTADWSEEVRDALLWELTNPEYGLDWPMPEPSSRPLPKRPPVPRLYQPPISFGP